MLVRTLGSAERRLLAEMPLHAITPVHGEAGLQERLAIEIAGLFGWPDLIRPGHGLAAYLRNGHVSRGLTPGPWEQHEVFS